jgi:hypothetical protein
MFRHQDAILRKAFDTKEYRTNTPNTKEYRINTPNTKEYRINTPNTKEYRINTPNTKEYRINTTSWCVDPVFLCIECLLRMATLCRNT